MAREIFDTWYKGKFGKEFAVPLIDEFLQDAREQDIADLEAMGDPALVLIASLETTEDLAVFRGEDMKLLAIVGECFQSACPGRNVWMIGTNEIYNGYVRPLLMRAIPQLIRERAKRRGMVYSFDFLENERAMRWISRQGAVWLPEEYESSGRKWRFFYIPDKGVL